MKIKAAHFIFYGILIAQIPYQLYCLKEVLSGNQPNFQKNFVYQMVLQPAAFVFDRNPLFAHLTFEVQLKDSSEIVKIPYKSSNEKFHSFIEYVLLRRVLSTYANEELHTRLVKYYICQKHLEVTKNLEAKSVREILEAGPEYQERHQRDISCD